MLVWQGATEEMNPSIDRWLIVDAYEADPTAAASEYGAEFRTDVEGFVSREAVEAVTVPGRHELPPVEDTHYTAFTDPSGGSRDSFTLAIAHIEDGLAVLDCVRERRPPFSPESVVEEYSALLKTYRCRRVTGDRYGGEWPRERFAEHGIEYRTAKQAKSDIYAALLPAVNSGKVELLDDKVLAAQLVGLERRTGRGGRDSIDHPPRGRDDVANSVAGVLVEVSAKRERPKINPSALSVGPNVGGFRWGEHDTADMQSHLDAVRRMGMPAR